MKFEYSKNPEVIKRINKLKNAKKIYYIIAVVVVLICINLAIGLDIFGNMIPFIAIISFLFFLISTWIYNLYIVKNIQDSFERELNPELLLNINIYLLKQKPTKKQSYYYLSNIALAYIYNGEFDNAKKVLDELEKKDLDKICAALLTQKKIQLAFYKKDYKTVIKLQEKLLEESKFLNKKLKCEILFNMEMLIAMIDKDKEKLNMICKTLEKSNKNIDRADYLYIKSLFFEEKDNKYKKMLDFEGGNLFYDREELEKQDITTKNNIKPNKYKQLKIMYMILFVVIIIYIITFAINIL